jgi:probable F420-dependent oxidoreductase
MAAFRFALQAASAASPAAWRDLARKTEDLGYSTLYVPDHLGDQWAPMIAVTLAAEATTTLRVGTLVLDNDFRHPLVLAKEAATLDIVTGGRFEFGLGAGWMTTDYEQSGIPMDKPSVRVARLAESLAIMRALWRDGSATFSGAHYRVTEAAGTPVPVTPGGPPLVIGGGSRRVLTLAGEYADVVSVVPSLNAGYIGPEVAAEAVVEKYADRVRWAREAAGERAGDLELQCWTAAVQVVPNAAEVVATLAPLFDLTPDQLRAAPLALIGTAGEITEQLRARRQELGFSYIVVHEAEMEALAPVIAELAGT